ncbi:MAG: hypothetical protein ACREIC_18710 [Limisphaerales bacterium]
MNPQAGELLVQEIAPRIRSSMNGRPAFGCEDAEEQAQDAVVIAAQLLLSAQARGKQVTPGNIAYYAVGLVRQGRRSSGQSKTDVMHPYTQINGRAAVVSLDAPLTSEAEGEEIMSLHDSLAANAEDPAITAGRRLDWATLLSSLDAIALALLVCMAAGEPLTSLVPKLKRTRSTLQSEKNRLARLVREHLGQNILQQVQEVPRWRDNLSAWHAKSACRYERQPA